LTGAGDGVGLAAAGEAAGRAVFGLAGGAAVGADEHAAAAQATSTVTNAIPVFAVDRLIKERKSLTAPAL
jgi:hypothetical protein